MSNANYTLSNLMIFCQILIILGQMLIIFGKRLILICQPSDYILKTSMSEFDSNTDIILLLAVAVKVKQAGHIL